MASGASLGKATIDLELEYAKVTKALDIVNKRMGNFESKMKKASNRLKGVFTVAGIAGFGKSIASTFDRLDTIGKTADKIGITTDALQELRFAAEQTGVETKTLDMAMQRFTRRTAEAVQGKGELVADFEALGIALTNVDGTARATTDVFYDYADAIANTKDSGEQLRLAFKGFDSEGAALVNTFKEGAAGVKELGDQLRANGGIVSNEAIRNAEEAKDAMNLFAKSFTAAKDGILVKLAPAIIYLAEKLLELPDLYQSIITAVADFMFSIRESALSIIQFADDSWKAVTDMVTKIKGSISGGLTTAMDTAVDLTEDVKSGFWSMYDEVVGNSWVPDMVIAIGEWFGKLPKLMVDPAEDATSTVSSFFEDMGSSIKGIIKGVITGTTDLKSALKSLVADIGGKLLDGALDSVLDPLLGSAGGIGKGIGSSVFGKIGGAFKGIFGGGGSYAPVGGMAGAGGAGTGIAQAATTFGSGVKQFLGGIKNLFGGKGGGMFSGGMGGAAIPLAIGAFGMARFAKSKQQKQEANMQFGGMNTGINEALNQVSSFRGQLNGDDFGEFFITLNEGWTSTIQALKKANLIVEAQGALYDENGNQLIKMKGNVDGVRDALAGAAITGHTLNSSFAEANSSSGDMRISVVGDFEAIKTSIQAAGAIGVGTFKDIQKTATGASVSVQGDLRKWKTYLDGAIGVAISNMTNGLGDTVNQAEALTNAFKDAARAASQLRSPSGSSSGMQRFASGGIAHKPSIFGEAGPEAAVPLPDGRNIPVVIKGGMSDEETNSLLRKLIKAVERSNMSGFAKA